MFPIAALPFISMPPPRAFSEAPEEVLTWRRNQRRSHLLPFIAAAVAAIPIAFVATDGRGVLFGLFAWVGTTFIVFWPGWITTIFLNYRLDRALLKAPLASAQVTGVYERTVRGRPNTTIWLVFELEAEGKVWELSMVKVENPSIQIGQTYEVLMADGPLAMALVGERFCPVRPGSFLRRMRRSL